MRNTFGTRIAEVTDQPFAHEGRRKNCDIAAVNQRTTTKNPRVAMLGIGGKADSLSRKFE